MKLLKSIRQKKGLHFYSGSCIKDIFELNLITIGEWVVLGERRTWAEVGMGDTGLGKVIDKIVRAAWLRIHAHNEYLLCARHWAKALSIHLHES
jgi:hypothetical protein